MAQGFQRRLGQDGRVLPLLTPSPQLLVRAGYEGSGCAREAITCSWGMRRRTRSWEGGQGDVVELAVVAPR